jgi:glutamate-1-semialdehyde 2,1-aminomutase
VLVAGIPDGFHVAQEVELAESLRVFLPWVGTWWFCRNQDEAMREVLAWARRSSGKNQILTLEGGARLRIGAGSDGTGQDVSVREISSWSADRIISVIRNGAAEMAAVVLEPLMTRLGVVPMSREAVKAITDACREADVVLVLDERVSGFRVARGGAASWAAIEPDAAVYGSALGGGFPIGVAAFNADRDDTAPDADEILATPHPVSLAAAEAVLSILKNDTTYQRLEERSMQLADGILNLADRFNRSIVINRVGSIFALYVGVDEVATGDSARQADPVAYRRLVTGLRDEGVLLPPIQGGTAFVSAAHGAKDIEETLTACEQVLLRLHQEDMP